MSSQSLNLLQVRNKWGVVFCLAGHPETRSKQRDRYDGDGFACEGTFHRFLLFL